VSGEACSVCGGPLDGEHRARCLSCGAPFHQPWSATAPVPTCGKIFVHPEAQGLVFLCLGCARAIAP
jgi:hypothetical protein